MPCDYSKYPKDWKDIRPDCLKQDGTGWKDAPDKPGLWACLSTMSLYRVTGDEIASGDHMVDGPWFYLLEVTA